MPKLIPELRERLVRSARERLLSSRVHDITVRDVAADCSTAVGTVYNYFPSKDYLIAAVMLEDWFEAVESMKKGARAAGTVEEGFRSMDAALRAFVDRYSPAWKRYSNHNGAVNRISEHHRDLVAAISGCVEELLDRFGRQVSPAALEVLSEIVLTAGQREPEALDALMPVIEKIIA
ncbi:MAG: TetR/AcrR family transcriptional regulator [Oscillospiraceae bacterium]|nr:TetR/AcrR family transcriptional regulator [Oscillospiraceae bacterium]